MKKLSAILAGATLMLCGGVARAQDINALNGLIKTFNDTSKPVAERETALQQATELSRNKGSKEIERRIEAFKKEIGPLLDSLVAKKTDTTYERFILLAIAAFEPFAPFPDIAPHLRPYFASNTPGILRIGALEAVRKHGGSGYAKDLIAIVKAPPAADEPPKTREALERAIVRACQAIDGKETTSILAACARSSTAKGVKLVAVRALGELKSTRPPGEVNEKDAIEVLKELSVRTSRDLNVSCEAAGALLRYDSWDGIGEVMERISADKRGGTDLTYRCICEAAHVKGFMDVPPERFNQLDPATRAQVVQAMKDWWAKARTTHPAAGLFETLKAAGIKVPADPKSKEAVTALIEGLDLEDRSLRYACLDAFVRLTGRTDFGRTFKLYVEGGGRNALKLEQQEPAEGYMEGSARAERLRALQKERAKEARAWWDKNSANATFVNGTWTVPK